MLLGGFSPVHAVCLASQENRIRLREEARRQRLIEKRREEVKNEIIVKV